jgi:hypothetical protein
MKLGMDNTLRFWVDVAYEGVKSDHLKLTKRRLIAQILRQYERPRFLTKLADAERDAQDELEEFP